MLRPARSPDVTLLHFYALASWKEKTTSTEQESDMKNSSRISFSTVSSIRNFVSASVFQFPLCFIRRFLISPQRRSVEKYNRKDKFKQVPVWPVFLYLKIKSVVRLLQYRVFANWWYTGVILGEKRSGKCETKM